MGNTIPRPTGKNESIVMQVAATPRRKKKKGQRSNVQSSFKRTKNGNTETCSGEAVHPSRTSASLSSENSRPGLELEKGSNIFCHFSFVAVPVPKSRPQVAFYHLGLKLAELIIF